MSEFIRPAMSESWLEKYEDQEWGISEAEDDGLVSPHPEIRLIPHPFPSDPAVQPATASEALYFWLEGGWDES